MKGAGIFLWPKAIHEGNGKAAFIVDPATTDKQVEALSQIFTGQLGGMPWELLGPTFEVAGSREGRRSPSRAAGEKARSASRAWARGVANLKNPVNGEDHIVNVDLPTGFIWKKGEAGQGSFHASAAGLSVELQQDELASTTTTTGRTPPEAAGARA